MRRGLVVGKFMPLHRGHQLLIETALAQCDDLTIIVYDSNPPGDYPDMPIEKRLGWLMQLYPQAEIIIPRKDLEGIPEGEKDTPKYSIEYAKDIEFLGKFDVVFSSEEYGEAFAQALGAEHIVVDQARFLVPISGTQIRENVYEHRGWLDPLVYRSLIQKVVFVGTESTGKSTISQRLAEEYNTQWVHEYGRELWVAQGGTGSFADMLKIAEKQYQREQAATLHSRTFLFCDTNAWTTLHWSLMYHQTADARITDLVERTKDEYIWVLCDNDFDWVQDGWRELPGEKGENFQLQQSRDLLSRGITHSIISGPLEYRVEQMKGILGRYSHSVLSRSS